MENIKKNKILDNKLVVGVVFIVTAIILITAFVLMIALSSRTTSEQSSSNKVSSNYEAPWIHPSRHD